MYSHCLFCHRELGRNDVIEHMPTGRAQAFDPAKGRLWIVCVQCQGWNLVPIEQRWEAVEECERLSFSLLRRYSSGEISLAVAGDATRLIRIGSAPQGEFACWRYESRFRRRRWRRRLRQMGTASTLGGLAIAGGAVFYVTASAVMATWAALAALSMFRDPGRNAPDFMDIVATLPNEEDGVPIFKGDLKDVRFVRYDGEGLLAFNWPSNLRIRREDIPIALGLTLPLVNRKGGRPDEVSSAVAQIVETGGPEAIIEQAMRERWVFNSLERSTRLALEMAGHEEMEAEALRGELRRLKFAWRRAEELANISDGLFLEQETAILSRLKRDLTPVSR